MVDTARYFFAVLMIVMFPVALLYWFLIHPFIGLWRRLGTWVTYTVVIATMAAVAYVLFLYRDLLLAVDLGTNYYLLIVAIPLYLAGAAMDVKAKRHLKLYMLTGVPEVAPERTEQKLLEEGIYGRVRHPRYVAIMVGTAGWALFVDFMGVYLMLPLLFVGLWLVVLLEERELRARFGDRYEEYCERVPRFIPRFGAA